MQNNSQIWRAIRLARPGWLLSAALVFSLGAAIAHYLGADINWRVYWLGQAWVTLVQISKHFLNEYFEPVTRPASRQADRGETPPSDRLPKLAVLAAAGVCLTVAASLTLGLLQASGFNSVVLIILMMGFLEAFFYSTPPYRWSSRGYGELSTAITSTILTGSLSLLLQTGNLHRLLAMTIFPLAALHFALLLVQEFPEYAGDLKYGKNRLVARMGWERALTLHNILILTAFGLLGAAILLGMPFALGGPAMLALPIGGVQIWLMINLANGAKPNWRVLLFSGWSLYVVCAYLLAFAFWTH